MGTDYVVPRDEEERILAELNARQDAEAIRLKRLLALPDLSRAADSPLSALVATIKQMPRFKN
ncbi:MAG: hypothetical protein AAB505_01755, partial [Patescibacteria group bacterium]